MINLYRAIRFDKAEPASLGDAQCVLSDHENIQKIGLITDFELMISEELGVLLFYGTLFASSIQTKSV